MMSIFYVALGGALGAAGRYGVGLWVKSASSVAFPWATFSVNIVGSVLMGLVMGWLARNGPNEPLRLFMAVGVLGGFTTCSAFSMEVFELLERREIWLALIYAVGSAVAGLAAFFIGYAMLRSAGA